MKSEIGLIQRAKKTFADISLTPVEIDKELKQIEVEKGRMTLEVFDIIF